MFLINDHLFLLSGFSFTQYLELENSFHFFGGIVWKKNIEFMSFIFVEFTK